VALAKTLVAVGVVGLVFANLHMSMILNSSAEAAPMHPDVSTSSLAKLDCSFELTSNQNLRVKVKMSNQGGVDLFVLNRLWDLNSNGDPAVDREQVYRFVRDSELRLLWGMAPLPRLETTTYENIPYATALKPKSSLEWDYSTKLPVTEYNVYFTGRQGAAHRPSAVQRVLVVVEFVAAQPGLTTVPSPLAPLAALGSSLKVSTPHAIDHGTSVTCASGPIHLEAFRRTDEFSRYTRPGEKPEPLVLSP
jgi:hypothetical protein